MPFAAPLEIDRRPLLKARVATIRTAIGRAKTDLTIYRAMERARNDPDIGAAAKASIARYGAEQLASLKTWGDSRRKWAIGTKLEVNR